MQRACIRRQHIILLVLVAGVHGRYGVLTVGGLEVEEEERARQRHSPWRRRGMLHGDGSGRGEGGGAGEAGWASL
jgi:hypothetical protein